MSWHRDDIPGFPPAHSVLEGRYTAELSQINADKRLPQCGVRIQSPLRPYDIKNPAVQGLPIYLRIFLIVLCSYFA